MIFAVMLKKKRKSTIAIVADIKMWAGGKIHVENVCAEKVGGRRNNENYLGINNWNYNCGVYNCKPQ